MKPLTDLPTVSRIQDLNRTPEGSKPTPAGVGPSFKETFEQIRSPMPNGATALPNSKAGLANGIKFSQHALERLRSRGIAMGPDEMMRLQSAVEKADKKGSKDSLVLMGDSAFVVSVKNKTVVTVMDRSMMKDNVVTNIDSTVVL